MKTIIISSSLSSESKSHILCMAVYKLLIQNIDCELIDLKNIELKPFHNQKSSEMVEISKKIKEADNLIIGMGVHNYSINDNLKILLDTCFEGAEGKFFGILCAAGGERSYLSTMHLSQICMNEWRMIQLPRVVYASRKHFSKNKISSKETNLIIHEFTKEFIEIGKKLL